MRSKLLIMSSAALLAGTLAAASQSLQPGGATQEKGQQGASQGVKSNEGTREQKGSQAQGRPGQAQPDQDKAKGQTQGQAQRDQDKQQGQRPAQTQGQAPRDQQGQTQRDQDRTRQGAQEGERGGNVSVSFTTEQRTKIRETVLKERNAPRLGKVEFSIKEGTVVPRTVRVIEIPDVIVEIHPEWRGFRYFIVNEQLVIVEPDTLRIVAVLDV